MIGRSEVLFACDANRRRTEARCETTSLARVPGCCWMSQAGREKIRKVTDLFCLRFFFANNLIVIANSSDRHPLRSRAIIISGQDEILVQVFPDKKSCGSKTFFLPPPIFLQPPHTGHNVTLVSRARK